MPRFPSFCSLAFIALFFALRSAAAEAPRVVASIKPVHALVAGVMQGTGTPYLLVEGRASPHGHGLRPRDARALAEADLVFWIGASLEGFLVRPLETLAGTARQVSLARVPGVKLLPLRAAVARTAGALSLRDDTAPADPHIWLDPENVRAMLRAIATALGETDPRHRSLYLRNTEKLVRRLAMLDTEIRDRLAPVRDVPFVVYHDAYAYFEHRFGLTVRGAITGSSDRPPGARRIRAIRRLLQKDKIRCLFHEPGARPALIRTVLEGTDATAVVLDPLGVALPAGPEAYFTLMRGLVRDLVRCLARPP